MKKLIIGLMLCGLTTLGGVTYANQEKPSNSMHNLVPVESGNSKSLDNVISDLEQGGKDFSYYAKDFFNYMFELVDEDESTYIPFVPDGGYPRCVGMMMPFLLGSGVAMYFACQDKKYNKRNRRK